jgi:MraZ protein
VVYTEPTRGRKWGKVGALFPTLDKNRLKVGEMEHMFLGEYAHTIDDKGRLTLPAKYRTDLASGVVVTRGLDKCLFVFPMEEWKRLSEKVSALPLTDVSAREFRRLLFSGATDADLDKQGRVLLPQYLREYAGLNGNVIVAGLNTHMEIWAPDAWNTIRASIDSADNVEQWAKLGI